MNPKTKKAIENYGYKICIEAFRMHHFDGNGASTIGYELGLSTRQADAAINAGRELYETKARVPVEVLQTFNDVFAKFDDNFVIIPYKEYLKMIEVMNNYPQVRTELNRVVRNLLVVEK